MHLNLNNYYIQNAIVLIFGQLFFSSYYGSNSIALYTLLSEIRINL